MFELCNDRCLSTHSLVHDFEVIDGIEHFDRDLSRQLRILGAIDCPHTTMSDHFNQTILSPAEIWAVDHFEKMPNLFVG
jgi:hypothetical protein